MFTHGFTAEKRQASLVSRRGVVIRPSLLNEENLDENDFRRTILRVQRADEASDNCRPHRLLLERTKVRERKKELRAVTLR